MGGSQRERSLRFSTVTEPAFLAAFLPVPNSVMSAGTQRKQPPQQRQQQQQQRGWKPAAAPSPPFSTECAKWQFCIQKEPIERPIAFPARLQLAAFAFFIYFLS